LTQPLTAVIRIKEAKMRLDRAGRFRGPVRLE
jgi:hypothetical protein